MVEELVGVSHGDSGKAFRVYFQQSNVRSGISTHDICLERLVVPYRHLYLRGAGDDMVVRHYEPVLRYNHSGAGAHLLAGNGVAEAEEVLEEG